MGEQTHVIISHMKYEILGQLITGEKGCHYHPTNVGNHTPAATPLVSISDVGDSKFGYIMLL